MMRALRTHLAKDLRIEWRSLDAMISMSSRIVTD